jgi:N-acetylmuramoyl-L-alanine amidase
MKILQQCCRWIGLNFFLFFLLSVFLLSYALQLPIRYRTIISDVPLEYTPTYNALRDKISLKEINCLADNIFFEAGNQPDKGKVAVGYVTINRLLSKQYPDNICNIVYQRNHTTCQFSWVCIQKHIYNRKIKEDEVWQRSLTIAYEVVDYYDVYNDPTNGALFYHSKKVRPPWSRRFITTAVINDHIFYRPNNGP